MTNLHTNGADQFGPRRYLFVLRLIMVIIRRSLSALLILTVMVTGSSAMEGDELEAFLHEYGPQFEDKFRDIPPGLTLCVNASSFLSGFERALAAEIGATLLVDVNVVDLEPQIPDQALDAAFPYPMGALYVLLARHCDGFMGFILSPGFPDWLHVTRPYFSSGHVLAVTDGSVGDLGDLQAGLPVGSRLGDSGDLRFLTYLQALAVEQQWKRLAYFDTRLMLDRLIDGTLAAALVWEPSLSAATGGKPSDSGIHTATLPFAVSPTEMGIAVSADNAFWRTTMDEAITELEQAGTIKALLEQYHLILHE